MGRFADSCLDGLSPAELDAFERLMEVPDQELYAWINGSEAVAQEFDTPLFRRLRAFHLEGGA